MSKATALPEAKRLKEALLDCGVPMVSIELCEGRPADGDLWNNQFVVTDMGHHTVSRYSPTNKTPCLSIIKFGRSDLPGPLCNGYGGWDLVARIITLGYANHPGRGGPLTVPSGVDKPKTYTIPQDSARRYAFGWEFEGGLAEADWDRVYTAPNGKKMNFHEFMARCLNGTQQMYDLPLGAHTEHKTWSSEGKIDRLGYTAASGMNVMKVYRDKPTRQVLMPDGKTLIDIGTVQDQFRIAAGIEGGKVARNADVVEIQRALNQTYGTKLTADGTVDDKTLDAWRKHEKATVGTGRAKIPDQKSLEALFPKASR